MLNSVIKALIKYLKLLFQKSSYRTLQCMSMMMLPCYSLTTNLVPSTYFCVKGKKALGTRLSNNRKEKFYTVFCCRKLKWKRSKS